VHKHFLEEDFVEPVDPADFRAVMSHFATGVVVVTGRAVDGTPVGMTAQSFSALSLDPPLVMVCPARSSTSWPRIGEGHRFAVNVLAADQAELSRHFARSAADKFDGQAWTWGEYGCPLLDGAIAHIECDLEAVHPGGDHYIALGRVRKLASRLAEPGAEPSPLLFFRSGYRSLTPSDAPR
jgi:3-hydroxy-9,10-secoandrosta-1,3,5(10)-triene-9,17-dione monooxygenase reductase component